MGKTPSTGAVLGTSTGVGAIEGAGAGADGGRGRGDLLSLLATPSDEVKGFLVPIPGLGRRSPACAGGVPGVDDDDEVECTLKFCEKMLVIFAVTAAYPGAVEPSAFLVGVGGETGPIDAALALFAGDGEADGGTLNARLRGDVVGGANAAVNVGRGFVGEGGFRTGNECRGFVGDWGVVVVVL